MAELDLDAIWARAEDATPGPWKCWNGWGPVIGSAPPLMAMRCIGPDAYEPGGVMASNNVHPEDRDLYATRADAEFIAHAREDIPLLLQALEIAYADLDEAQADIEMLTGERDRARDLAADLENALGLASEEVTNLREDLEWCEQI